MSDTTTQASEIEEAQDTAAEALARAAAIALATEDEDDPRLQEAAQKAAKSLIVLGVIIAMTSGQRADATVDTKVLEQKIREVTPEIEAALTADIRDGLVLAAESRADRLRDEDESAPSGDEFNEPPAPADTAEARRSWATNVGRSMTTRLMSERAPDFIKPVEEHLGVELHKIWMTRMDSRVRSAHRKLQGNTHPLDKPFWRELGTGRVLRYPGDPSAPIEQTANCRCWLWFVPADQAAEAEDTFSAEDSEFAIAAAGQHELTAAGLEAEFDVSYGLEVSRLEAVFGLTAASERSYDESKHKRDATGRFSKKSESSRRDGGKKSGRSRRLPPGFDYEEWLAKGGWDSLIRKYPQLAKLKGKGGKGGGTGKGGGSGDKKSAREALEEMFDAQKEELDARITGEREEATARKEAAREARRVATEERRAAQRQEDAARRGQRLSQDEAMRQLGEDIRENERNLRVAQREQAQSEDYIRQMRLRGEDPKLIEAERNRLKGVNDTVGQLTKRSRDLGTSDEVRSLRDRVRYSRLVEDDHRRTSREQFDAAIRNAQRKQDAAERDSAKAMAARHKALRDALRQAKKDAKKALKGAGEEGPKARPCVIVLLPKGDRTITYKDGDVVPMHMTVAYLGREDDHEEVDIDHMTEALESIAGGSHPMKATISGKGTLGEDGEEVAFVESQDIAGLHDTVRHDDELEDTIDKFETHPMWIPHVSGLDGGYGDEVEFDRIALWLGEDRREFPLGAAA